MKTATVRSFPLPPPTPAAAKAAAQQASELMLDSMAVTEAIEAVAALHGAAPEELRASAARLSRVAHRLMGEAYDRLIPIADGDADRLPTRQN